MILFIFNDKPSWVKVQYENDFQRQELKKFLTIKIPGAQYTAKYRSHQWDGTKCFLNRFNETFPIGFLYRVVKQFPDVKIIDKREYLPIPFKVPDVHGIKLRMYQKEGMLYAFEHKNCLIQAATNAGKSAMMAGLIQLLWQEKIIILVHRKELLLQLRLMLMEGSGRNVGYVMADDVSIDPYVNIVMVMTMLKRIEADPNVRHMYENSRVMMVDEAHHMKAETHLALLRRSKAVYRFGMSGTIPDEGTYDGWMCRQFIGDVVFNISNKELIDQGISAEPMIYMIKHYHHIDYHQIVEDIRADNASKGITYPTPWKEREEVYKRVFAKVLQEHIVRNDDRSMKVVEKVANEYKDRQTLIVVDYLDHGQRLYDLLEPRIGEDNVDFIHGLADTREGSLADFRKGTLRVLISSSIIDEGIDISRIQMLVLAGGKKSKRQILQRIGRGLRRKTGENVVVILDIFDLDKKYLERHSKERLKLYNKEGFHVEILES